MYFQNKYTVFDSEMLFDLCLSIIQCIPLDLRIQQKHQTCMKLTMSDNIRKNESSQNNELSEKHLSHIHVYKYRIHLEHLFYVNKHDRRLKH